MTQEQPTGNSGSDFRRRPDAAATTAEEPQPFRILVFHGDFRDERHAGREERRYRTLDGNTVLTRIPSAPADRRREEQVLEGPLIAHGARTRSDRSNWRRGAPLDRTGPASVQHPRQAGGSATQGNRARQMLVPAVIESVESFLDVFGGGLVRRSAFVAAAGSCATNLAPVPSLVRVIS